MTNRTDALQARSRPLSLGAWAEGDGSQRRVYLGQFRIDCQRCGMVWVR